MLKNIKAWKAAARTRRELSVLSDRELADIGIERQDIRWIAAQTK